MYNKENNFLIAKCVFLWIYTPVNHCTSYTTKCQGKLPKGIKVKKLRDYYNR